MKVAVVILNYNGQKFLEQFLPNVIAHCDPALAEVIVADNASTDNSVAFMRERFPDIRLIENGSNGGFSTGYTAVADGRNATAGATQTIPAIRRSARRGSFRLTPLARRSPSTSSSSCSAAT